jgi:biotin operon repressor
MKLEKIDFDQLKKMAVALGSASYTGEDGKEMLFLGGKKLKTIAISKEDLAKKFDEAIKSIPDEIVNDLPDAIIDFYNDFFASESSSETAGAEAGAASETKEEKAEEKAEEKPEEKKEKPAKEKKEKPAKEKKEKPAKEKKAPAELSVFGHKKGSQAAALDDLLNTGESVSLADLSAKSGRSALGVKSHIKHLISDRGLKIEEKEGVYKLIKA